MKNKEYTRQELLAYFKEYDYIMTFRQSINDAFYHWKTNKHVLVPYEEEDFSELEIVRIFEKGEGTELDARIEYLRFEVFIDQYRKN